MQTYQIKRLIFGIEVSRQFSGQTLIAVPDSFWGKPLEVKYNGSSMVIPKVGENHLTVRSFDDKFGRRDRSGETRQYRLVYYNWQPQEK